MKSVFTRLPLALAVVLFCSSLSADELQFSDLKQRLGMLEGGVQPVSFLQDTELPASEPIQGQPPRELGQSGDDRSESESCHAGCTCDECCPEPIHGVYYTQVELLWMRAHVNEAAVGKLSEQYEIAPRFVIGYEDNGGIGTRVRFWTYGRTTPNLTSPADAVRFEFDVLDLEATSRFGNDRSELVVGGGIRWADLKIGLDGETVVSEMPGITFAADLRSTLCRDCFSEWATVAGARWALLGGDWEGGTGGFLNTDRDDNVNVTEIYGGVEYVQHYCGYDLYGRLVFEVQNWHSDVAAQTAGTDSISFIGPGLHLGMNF